MDIKLIEEQITRYKAEGKHLFASSSFQTHSLPMLHILSRIDKSIPVYFIQTGFHFPETLSFRDRIREEFGINILDLKSHVPKIMQKDPQGKLLFASDPDYCCHLNKVQPMEHLLVAGNVWINGVRADQNANRKNMKPEQKTPTGALRYHPMLHWSGKMIYDYIREYNLPKHPLEAKGYFSIGCEPCTQKVSADDSREGRWVGMNKTECGLHTELIEK